VNAGEHTLKLLKRFHAEFTDFRRDQDSVRARLSSLEQHFATMTVDLTQIRVEMDGMRDGISLIRRRLDLVEA
jgi:hypothetical protein